MAGRAGFTLIELLAVMVVIVVLCGTVMAMSTFVRLQIARYSARTQIAAIATALEAYKSDWGYYPRTGPERLSADGVKEATNNCTLLNALCPTNTASGRKMYLRFPVAVIRTNPAPFLCSSTNFQISAGVSINVVLIAVPNIFDPWGNPYVYYNSPATTFAISNNVRILNTSKNGFTVGGQVKLNSYDIFSYGPDGLTYIPGTTVSGGGTGNQPWLPAGWASTNSANDDITNWSR